MLKAFVESQKLCLFLLVKNTVHIASKIRFPLASVKFVLLLTDVVSTYIHSVKPDTIIESFVIQLLPSLPPPGGLLGDLL